MTGLKKTDYLRGWLVGIFYFSLSFVSLSAQSCTICSDTHQALLTDSTQVIVDGKVSIKLVSGNGLNPFSIRLFQPILVTLDETDIPLRDVREVIHGNSEKTIALSSVKIEQIIKITNVAKIASCLIGVLGITILIH
ncbi:MAG: hypothetical protein GXO90_05405 [FCB group bacterium]|nr:hypothetical protein [FCB group bacterium]